MGILYNSALNGGVCELTMNVNTAFLSVAMWSEQTNTQGNGCKAVLLRSETGLFLPKSASSLYIFVQFAFSV